VLFYHMRLLFLFVVASLLSRECLAQISISVATNGTVRLSRSSLTNQQYLLQRSIDLQTWKSLGPRKAGTGDDLSWTDTTTSNRVFYRIRSDARAAYPLFGINFSPYTNGQSPEAHTQISRAQVEERMRLLIPHADWIRTFGMVDGLEVSGQVGHQLGFKTALGAWIGRDMQANLTQI